MEIACPRCKGINVVDGAGDHRCLRCGAELPHLAARDLTPPTGPPAEAPDPPAPATPLPTSADGPPLDLDPDRLARVRDLEVRLASNPNARALYLQLERLYDEGGRRDLAIKVLKRCLVFVDPKNVTVKARLDVLTRPAKVPAADGDAAGGDPTPAPETPLPTAPRRRGLFPVLLALTTLLLVGAIVKRVFFPRTFPLVADRAYSPSDPAWSPDGESVAFLSHEEDVQQLCVVDVATREVRRIATVEGWAPGSFSWSPDGLQMAYVSRGAAGDADASTADGEMLSYLEAVHVVDVATGNSHRIGFGSEPAWSPDGVSLLMSCTDTAEGSPYMARSFPCVTNTVTKGIVPLPAGAQRPVFSPRGDRIAFEGAGDGRGLMDGADGADSGGDLADLAEGALSGGATTFQGARKGLSQEMEARDFANREYSSDGALLAPANVFSVKPDGTDLTQLTEESRASTPLWLPDGSRIVYAYVDDTGRIGLWSMAPDGTDKKAVVLGDQSPVSPALVQITPDGKRVVFAARVPDVNEAVATLMTGGLPIDLYVAAIDGSGARRIECKHTFKQWPFTIAPDGKHLAYTVPANNEGRMELWITHF